MLRISSDALAYACESSGRCCQGWAIGFDKTAADALPRLLQGIPRYAGKTLLREGYPDSAIHYRLAACDEHERCVFLNEDNRCDLHARFGPQAKSLVTRQYPHLATATPLGTDITLTYSCPSSAKRLLDPGPFRVIRDPPHPPEMTLVRSVPAHYPVQTKAGALLSWEAFRAKEDRILALLAAREGDPCRDLARIRMGMENGEGGGPLPVPPLREVERLGGEAVGLAIARLKDAKPWKNDTLKLDRLEAFALADGSWERTRRAWSHEAGGAWQTYRHYLSAKCFGNMLFITYGLIPGFQTVLLLGLLVRLEAARRAAEEGRSASPGDVAGAAEVVDRLFPHESGLFDFWSRKGGALDSLIPPVSAALILAGTPAGTP